MADIGKVLKVDIEVEMKRSYIAYAMTVIVQRALPDVRDGLKPVQRRILYSMNEMGLTHDKPHRKSARVVGDVLGKYHPHGETAVYDAMVRLAQDFVCREILVDGHGNFGSVDGDPPAASRYTEVRLTRLASELLRDIDKETVDFRPNFDESEEEPVVVPARFPNLLANGASGIAVGMATNIPPHNLAEIIDGAMLLLKNPDATSADLLQKVKGPDFPTGGLILGREGIRQAFETGRGSIVIRAEAEIEVGPQGKPRIVVTEIPFQVSKAKLIEKIAELVRDKKIDGITDLRDETDRTGMRIVIEARRDVNPRILLNKLFKYTPMQVTFGVIMLALVGGKPRILSLKEALLHYLDYQKEIIVRRTRFDLKKAEERAHILEGLLTCLDNLDAVINLIRSSPDAPAAKEGLMTTFSLSERQAQAILDLRLQRLTALERAKIEEEFQELQKNIAYFRAVLDSNEMVIQILETELGEIRQRYGSQRRTKIIADPGHLSDEDLIADEPCVVTMTHQGYVKRQPLGAYKPQKRGGRGIAGMNTKVEDFVERIFVTTTRQTVLFFTNAGRVFKMKVYEVPEAGRTARGTAIVNLLNLSGEEQVTAVVPIGGPSEIEGYLFMCTQRGIVKKSPIEEFASIRSNGLIAIGLNEGDELIEARYTQGDREMILLTLKGQSIRFAEEEVRSMGRAARGVRGIRLAPEDHVKGIALVEAGMDLLIVTSLGHVKRSPTPMYRSQGRGGKGIRAITLTSKTGEVAGVRSVSPDDQLMIITGEGILIRFKVKDVPAKGRTSQGVKGMRLDKGDKVLAIAKLTPEAEEMDDEGDDES